MNITVYLGASEGADPTLREAVAKFGTWIARSGNSLVYGGSRSGLMGVLAESVVTAGGEATGVEPAFFLDIAVQYENLTRLIVTKDMTERKAKMIELGDAFVALPGGTGTLEEIAESLSNCNLGLQPGKCVFLNIDGYYEPMRVMLDAMTAAGYLHESELRGNAVFADSVEQLAAIIAEGEDK